MARRPTVRGVKRYYSYTVEEAARATGASKGTVRRWLKAGLPAITDQKPLLILGADLIDFLAARRKAAQKCRPLECYCLSCRQPRSPAFGAVEFHWLTPTSGNVLALCEECSTVMRRRVPAAKLDGWRAAMAVTIRQGGEHLGDSANPCLNDHLPKETKSHA